MKLCHTTNSSSNFPLITRAKGQNILLLLLQIDSECEGWKNYQNTSTFNPNKLKKKHKSSNTNEQHTASVTSVDLHTSEQFFSRLLSSAPDVWTNRKGADDSRKTSYPCPVGAFLNQARTKRASHRSVQAQQWPAWTNK